MKSKNIIVAIIFFFCAASTHSQPQPYVPGNCLLKTTWGQDDYYNDACPVNHTGPNGHVMAGEVAVAMAQIMKYYGWPYPSGLGSQVYLSDAYGILLANFNLPFDDFQLMPNSLNANNTTQEKEFVSKLIYKCGVAVETKYSVTNSTADIEKIANALMVNFRYKPSARLVHSLDYTDDEWAALIDNEINNKRPVILATTLSGSDVKIVIVDGYPSGTDRYRFHFNPGDGNSTAQNFLDVRYSSSAVIGLEPDVYYNTLNTRREFSIAMDPMELLHPDDRVKFAAIAIGCGTKPTPTYTWLFNGTPLFSSRLRGMSYKRQQKAVRVSCILNDDDPLDRTVSNSVLLIPFTQVSKPSSNSPVCQGEPLRLSALGVTPGGGSANFNGNDQYLKIPGNELVVNDFTYELWVNPIQKPSAPCFEIDFSKTETDLGYSIALRYSNDAMILEFIDHGNPTEKVYKPQLSNLWIHLALVRRGRLLGIYVNGILAGTPLTITNAQLTTDTIFLGKEDQQYFQGWIDEFRFWNTALSQAEIQAGMLNEVDRDHPKYQNLVRYYKFNSNHALEDEKGGVIATAPNQPTNRPSKASYIWFDPDNKQYNSQYPVLTESPVKYGEYRLIATAFANRPNKSTTLNATFYKGKEPTAGSNSPVYVGNTIALKSNTQLVPGGGHVELNGINQFIVTPDLKQEFSSSDITLEIWFLAKGAGVIISEPDGHWNRSLLEAVTVAGDPNTLEIKARVGGLNPISLGTVSINKWNHAVVRYNSHLQQMDGILNGMLSKDISTGLRTMPAGQSIFYSIGKSCAYNMGSGAIFGGEVDEFRIWNSFITNDELQNIRNAQVSETHPLYNNLVACYNFDETFPLADQRQGDDATAPNGYSSLTADSYRWEGPDNFDSQNQNPQRGPATLAMQGNYEVYSQSPSGCKSETTSKFVNVMPLPIPKVTLDESFRLVRTGSSSTLTAKYSNGGTDPQFSYWTVKNINHWVSTRDTPKFTSTFADGEKIFCVMTSNAANVDPVTATSNTLTICLVDQIVDGGANSNSPLCSGSDLRLSVTNALMSGMQGATFQWRGPKDYTSTLPNPIIPDITEDMAGSYCVVATSSTGYKKAASINVVVTPVSKSQPYIETAGWEPESDIDIQHYAYAALGALLSFHILGPSTIPGGGRWNALEAPADNKTYQWTINGQVVAGATGVTFSNSLLQDMDEVQCIITTTSGCGSSVASNPIFVLNSQSTPLLKPQASYKRTQADQVILSAAGMVPGGGHIVLGNAANQYVAGSIVNKTFVDFTCEFWVRPEGFTSGNVYFSVSAAIPNNNLVLRQATPDSIAIEINKRIYKMAYAPPLNKWTHLAIIKKGSAITFLANGVPWYKVVLNSLPPVNMGTIQIGGHTGNPADNTFNGSIDEFRFWNTALSRQTLLTWEYKEVTSDHDNYNQLLAYLKFNSGSNLKEEVSGQLFTTPNSYTSAASDYWKYWWEGEHAPSVSILNENVTITISALEQLCRMYQVVALSPGGIESEWSNELIISDENLAIPGVNATGNGSLGP
ncbi:MAG: LamG-like jellyroll fold domain-containing protein [Bacteroidota bacterium]